MLESVYAFVMRVEYVQDGAHKTGFKRKIQLQKTVWSWFYVRHSVLRDCNVFYN